MLQDWLSCKLREPTPYKNFKLFEIDEKVQVDQRIKSYVIELLKDARFDLKIFQTLASRLGWTEAAKLLSNILPKTQKMRKGFFGEVLACAVLVEFFGYVIPVKKWRYAISSDQSLPGTDAIAIEKQGGAISEICFVESKTRTTSDTSASIDGYKQLKEDYSQKIPDMVFFVLSRLKETKDPLLDDFANYAYDRRDLPDMETFCLSLTWDFDAWTETILSNLEEETGDTSFPRLRVKRIRIKNLTNHIKELFEAIGVEVLSDDD